MSSTTNELFVQSGKFQCLVDVSPGDTLADVRSRILREFDHCMIPCQNFYMQLDHVRLSLEQEERKLAADVIASGCVLSIHARKHGLNDVASPRDPLATACCGFATATNVSSSNRMFEGSTNCQHTKKASSTPVTPIVSSARRIHLNSTLRLLPANEPKAVIEINSDSSIGDVSIMPPSSGDETVELASPHPDSFGLPPDEFDDVCASNSNKWSEHVSTERAHVPIAFQHHNEISSQQEEQHQNEEERKDHDKRSNDNQKPIVVDGMGGFVGQKGDGANVVSYGDMLFLVPHDLLKTFLKHLTRLFKPPKSTFKYVCFHCQHEMPTYSEYLWHMERLDPRPSGAGCDESLHFNFKVGVGLTAGVGHFIDDRIIDILGQTKWKGERYDLLSPHAIPFHNKYVHQFAEKEKHRESQILSRKRNPGGLHVFIAQKREWLLRNPRPPHTCSWRVPEMLCLEFLKRMEDWPEDALRELVDDVNATGDF